MGKIPAMGNIRGSIVPWIFPKAGNFPVVLAVSHTTSRFGTTGLAVPGRYGPRDQERAEIWRARAKSLTVRPPAEWVLSTSVTLFHAMVMSGWWLAVSAR